MGVPKEKREWGRNNIQINYGQKYHDLIKDMNLHIQESQQIPSSLQSKRQTLKHIIVKLSKPEDKETTLKAVREK